MRDTLQANNFFQGFNFKLIFAVEFSLCEHASILFLERCDATEFAPLISPKQMVSSLTQMLHRFAKAITESTI